MYRRCAVKFHKKQVEFISCVNMVERVKKARALPSGMSHLGVERYVLISAGGEKKRQCTIKNCF